VSESVDVISTGTTIVLCEFLKEDKGRLMNKAADEINMQINEQIRKAEQEDYQTIGPRIKETIEDDHQYIMNFEESIFMDERTDSQRKECNDAIYGAKANHMIDRMMSRKVLIRTIDLDQQKKTLFTEDKNENEIKNGKDNDDFKTENIEDSQKDDKTTRLRDVNYTTEGNTEGDVNDNFDEISNGDKGNQTPKDEKKYERPARQYGTVSKGKPR